MLDTRLNYNNRRNKIMTDAILLEKLTKNYGEKKAIDNIDLKVPVGSIFGLLGPNGAGKSTIINILAGLTMKTSGKASIMGIDIDAEPQAAKYQIGVVPQEIVLDTFFALREALEFYAGYYGIRPKDRKTDEIIEALGLKDKVMATARQLSGGMRRRFLVAKAMVHSPKVLILDEPTAGVDIDLREQLWAYVKELNKRGTTIILTTHYLEEAQELCDHIAFINHGKIIKSDRKDNLLSTLSSRKMVIDLAGKFDASKVQSLKLNIDQVNDHQIHIDLMGRDIGEVISGLQGAGLVIRDLSVEQADLAEVFKKVIVKS
jgi:ABC-2 type transport system ATP-binding protein